MTTHQTTAVLIPCLNEEQTIGKVVSDFRKELPDAQIYVYDNASDDHTKNYLMRKYTCTTMPVMTIPPKLPLQPEQSYAWRLNAAKETYCAGCYATSTQTAMC